jgi:hypothetical protein
MIRPRPYRLVPGLAAGRTTSPRQPARSITIPGQVTSPTATHHADSRRTGIRPSTPADELAITDLLLEAGLRPNMKSDELYWKYWQERADWPGSRSFVLTKGRQVLAHAAIIHGAFVCAGRRVRVIHMIDWAARPSAPVAGVSLMKHVSRLTDALLAVGGSEQTLRILPHLGFTQCGVVKGYVRPLHPLRVLTSWTGASWRVPPRFLRSAFWAVQAPKDQFPDWYALRVEPGDVRRIAALASVRREHGVSLERSESLLAYFLACPIASMELYALEKAGRLRGYFLLSHVPGQARIADSWLDTDAESDWRALFQCAVREAGRNRDAAELLAWASDSLHAGCLEKCGFHTRFARPVQVLPSKSFQMPDVAFRVQMLDTDAAFHHPGSPSLLL